MHQITFEKRVFDFAVLIIEITTKIQRNDYNRILSNQIIRSATSIGANYAEACEAFSNKEKIVKISICLKEARETQYWIAILERFNKNIDFAPIIQESLQIRRILGAIYKRLK